MSKQPESEDKYRVQHNPDNNENIQEQENISQPNGIYGNNVVESNIKNEKDITLQLQDNKEKVLRGGFPSPGVADNSKNTPLSQSGDRNSLSKSSKKKGVIELKASILKKSRYGKAEDNPPNPNLRTSLPNMRTSLGNEPVNTQLKSDRKEKISFKEEIHQIKVVENWKDYNSDNYDSTTCHCNTF
jgi:hypothetical protein